MRAHNRGLFRKLLVMTSVFLLVIFAIVALITYQSITQTQRSFERSVRAQALSIASTVDQEISSVRTLLSSMQSETNLRRLAVAYEAVSMYERKLMVDSAVSFLINVSNATQTVDHVDVYFPHFRRALSSKQPTYNELDDQEIAALQRDGILNTYAHHTSMVPLANGQYAVTAVFPSNENAIRTEKLFVVAAYPLLFLLEKLFGLVSGATLRDLSDTNTKVLKELASTAPGTFQHSLQVANLAEHAVA